MVDTRDLKSRAERRAGSNPATPTLIPYAKMVEVADSSTHPKHKHAALIFHNGLLVGWANNQGNEHAEIRALKVCKILGYKKSLTLLSVRISRAGKLKLAKPCGPCMVQIKKRGVACILYSTDDGMVVRLREEDK